MPQITAPIRYSQLLITLHWFTLLLLIAIYACIELREFFPKGTELRSLLKSWHFMLGLTLLGVTGLRLVARGFSPRPRQEAGWAAWAATGLHLTLYAFLLSMPVLGWAMLSSEGKAVVWLGWELPALLPPSEWRAEWLEELHGTLGKVGYGLIGLHATAGLWHHFVRRDGTLRAITLRCYMR